MIFVSRNTYMEKNDTLPLGVEIRELDDRVAVPVAQVSLGPAKQDDAKAAMHPTSSTGAVSPSALSTAVVVELRGVHKTYLLGVEGVVRVYGSELGGSVCIISH